MVRWSLRAAVMVAALAVMVVSSLAPVMRAGPGAAARASARGAQPRAAAAAYGQLPLAFELNEGQADAAARFVAHGSGYTLALTPSGALLALSHGTPATALRGRFALPGQPERTQPEVPATVLGTRWLGANSNPVMTGEQPLPGTVNYFIGNDPAKWHTNIPTYRQVRLHDVYPGVDLVYYGNHGQLEYDFVVAPGADPAAIQLAFTGAERPGVDLAGNLSLALPGGVVRQEKPLVYQNINGARRAVAGGYRLTSSERVGFALGRYNPQLPLVIDPAYDVSTYLGGSQDESGNALAVDSGGNLYITGQTSSTDFPLANNLQGAHTMPDVFVSKINASGTAFIWSTYLGGMGGDDAYGIGVDSGGNVAVAGSTNSSDFPTNNALQSTKGLSDDAFVLKLNAAGSALVFSTFLGGNDNDDAYALALDSSDNVYVTGYTQSTNFPTNNAYQSTYNGSGSAFVAKYSSNGSSLLYSTYLGGSNGDWGYGIAADASGNAFVTGTTWSTNFPVLNAYQSTMGSGVNASGFVTKVSPSGSTLAYSTYLGSTDFASSTVDTAIAVDAAGAAYVTGDMDGTFPTTTGAVMTCANQGVSYAFAIKLTAAGSALAYSTCLGASGFDTEGQAIAVDAVGRAFVTGWTGGFPTPPNPTYPVTANALQPNFGGHFYDAFVSELNTTATALIYSSFLGGTSDDYGYALALDGAGHVYVAGKTSSATGFPATNFAVQGGLAGGYDAFITKMTLAAVTTTGVFRPSNGVLYLKNANTTGPADITLAYGLPGDKPVTGDWTGKGYKSIGIYRSGTFYLRNSNTTGYADIVVPFGASTDIPVAGDWTGKGYDSIGVYRPSTSTFYLRDSNTSGPPDHTVTLGISGDVPIVGDWTGQGFDTVGVFRPSNGIVYLRNSNTTGFADISFVYGVAGDKPVVGDWDGNGTDTIGVDRGGRFLLRNSNSTGPANASFYLGAASDQPIAGPWRLPPLSAAPPPSPAHTPATGNPASQPPAAGALPKPSSTPDAPSRLPH